jgi:hypothetical protein
MPPTKIYGSLLLVGLLALSCVELKSQDLKYGYRDLSSFSYNDQQSLLRKLKPGSDVFTDKKAQKKYVELSEDQRQSIINGFEQNNFVRQPEIAAYLEAIAVSLQKTNPSLLPATPLILLDRSDIVNAYALGNNIIVINAGLLLFVESREELALIIAHELAHNILLHAENSLRETARRISSDEYNQSLNAVLDSKYERLSRLKKIMTSYSANRSRHTRYHESSADSLAIVLLKQAKIGFDAKFFLRLDSVQPAMHKQLQQPVRHHFEQYKLAFEESWLKQARGLSSRNYQFKDSSETNEDSLKTHPDCGKRYEATKSLSDDGMIGTPIPTQVKDIAQKIVTWNKIASLELTPALYYIFLEKQKNNPDPWYDLMASTIFSLLNYAEKDLRRFNAVGTRLKEHVAPAYYDLQLSLTRMNREVLEKNCSVLREQQYSQHLPAFEKQLSQALTMLDQETAPERKKIEQINARVFGNGTNNPYFELFHSLTKN